MLKKLYSHFAAKVEGYMIMFDGDETDQKSSKQSSSGAQSSFMKLTRKITTMDSFLQEHANTDQAYQLVNFIISHLEKIEKSKPEKHRYYKSIIVAKGNILGALLN